jgi:adenylate cyclase class IV
MSIVPLTAQTNFEVRAYIQNIDETKKALESLGAVFMGDYYATDYIYDKRTASLDFNNEFVRMRFYHRTQWNQKICNVIHKKRDQPEKEGKKIFFEEFDTLAQAQDFLAQNYICMFSYAHKGWEYHLKEIKIYVEDIEGLSPTVEIVGSNKKLMDEMFDTLSARPRIVQSVPYAIIQKRMQNAIEPCKKVFIGLG